MFFFVSLLLCFSLLFKLSSDSGEVFRRKQCLFKANFHLYTTMTHLQWTKTDAIDFCLQTRLLVRGGIIIIVIIIIIINKNNNSKKHTNKKKRKKFTLKLTLAQKSELYPLFLFSWWRGTEGGSPHGCVPSTRIRSWRIPCAFRGRSEGSPMFNSQTALSKQSSGS